MKSIVLIDGPSTNRAAGWCGAPIDWKRLRDKMSGGVVRMIYYHSDTTKPSGDGYSPMRPVLDWLEYNGYSVRMTPGPSAISTAIAVDAMEVAGAVDHVVIFSSDGSLVPLVMALQRRGATVTVIGTKVASTDALRRAADEFRDIEEDIKSYSRDTTAASKAAGLMNALRPIGHSTTAAAAAVDEEDDYEDDYEDDEEYDDEEYDEEIGA